MVSSQGMHVFIVSMSSSTRLPVILIHASMHVVPVPMWDPRSMCTGRGDTGKKHMSLFGISPLSKCASPFPLWTQKAVHVDSRGTALVVRGLNQLDFHGSDFFGFVSYFKGLVNHHHLSLSLFLLSLTGNNRTFLYTFPSVGCWCLKFVPFPIPI